jgi:DNA polymerase
MASRSEIIKTLDELGHAFQNLADQGHRGFDCSQSSLEKIANWGIASRELSGTLQDIRLDLGDCQRCRLARDRTHIVFGSGSSKAKLIFVGEGPGFEEDQQGEPFVGPAGPPFT